MPDRHLTPLLHFLGRAMFWRRRASLDDMAGATDADPREAGLAADSAAAPPPSELPPELPPNERRGAPPAEFPTSSPQSSLESASESEDADTRRPGWAACFFSRLAVWRRKPATAEAPEAEPEIQRPPPADADTSQPGRAARLLSRLAFWRRRPATDEAPEAEPEIRRPPPTEDEAETPPRPWGKRLLLVLTKKTVWLPAAAVLMASLGAVLSALVMRGQHGEQEQALRALRAEKLKLEQENQKLRAQPAPVPAVAAKQPVAIASSHPASESEALPPDPAANASGEGTDCIVTGKEMVGESLRRCIEMYNRAAGQ